MAVLTLTTPAFDTVSLLSASPLRGLDEAEQKLTLLTEDTVSLTLTTNAPVDFKLGSTLPLFGQLYTLNQIPQADKIGDTRYRYEMTLEGPQYHLLRVVFLDTDSLGNSLSPNVTLTGTLADFVQMLVLNMARVFSGAWGLGTVSAPSLADLNQTIPGDQTDTKTLSFDNANCLSVLQQLCAEWGTEFWIDYKPNDAPNRILNIGPVGKANPLTQNLTFSYGHGNGLYELTRKTAANSSFTNRAFVFGGSKNIPTNYRGGYATRLQLPYTGPNPQGPFSPWDSVLSDQASINANGLIEGVKVFEDIYPQRTGSVSTILVAQTDFVAFSDSTMDFDPFEKDATGTYKYIQPGQSIKVHFQTGELAGYEFDLSSFDVPSNAFYINRYTDEFGNKLPGTDALKAFFIQSGDTYVLLNMIMPDSYVQAAEAKLLAAGQAWLAENSTPSLEYSLEPDELFLKNLAGDTGQVPLDNPPNLFLIGDTIHVVDSPLGIDKYLRITGFTRDVLRPYKYTLTLGDARKISRLQQILKEQFAVKRAAAANTPSVGQTTSSTAATTDPGKTVPSALNPPGFATNYTLSVVAVPRTGYSPVQVAGPTLKRWDFGVDIIRKTISNTPLTDIIGRIQQSASKKP